MSFQQFKIKHFQKDKAVKVVYTGIDKRVKTLYVVPDPNTNSVTIGGKSWILSPETIYTHAGWPTVFVNHQDADPLDVLNTKRPITENPDRFNVAITSNVGRDLFASMKEKALDLATLAAFGALGGVVYVLYQMNTRFDELAGIIEQLAQTVGGQ